MSPTELGVGIYVRLSHDPDGTSTATARQQADCEALAAQRGLTVVRVYEDADISAYSRKARRPAFEAMLEDLVAGQIGSVLVWRSDRLARQPRDLERFLDAAQRSGGQLLSVTEPEFAGSSGLLILRMLVAFANHESGVKSERVARKWREQAEAGLPHRGGSRTWGYTPDFRVDPVEADRYRELVDRVLGGERTGAIARDFNARGVSTMTGRGLWTGILMRNTVFAPARAGLRVYRGQTIEGKWEPLVPRPRWEQACAVLQGRRTGTYRRTVTRHLLSSLAHCGVCGTVMGGTRRGQSRAVYRCLAQRGGCGRVSIAKDVFEAIISEAFLQVASTPAFDQLIAAKKAGPGDDSAELVRQLSEDDTALQQATHDHYVTRTLTRGLFLQVKDQLETRIAANQTALAARTSPIGELANRDILRQQWAIRDVAWQRSVLEMVIADIVVQPAKGRTQLERIHIEWLA